LGRQDIALKLAMSAFSAILRVFEWNKRFEEDREGVPDDAQSVHISTGSVKMLEKSKIWLVQIDD
jgi:hypothetical protein